MKRRIILSIVLGLGSIFGILSTQNGYAANPVSISFDRSGNDTPDVRFTEAQDGGGIVSFDNDEDGVFDFGFVLASRAGIPKIHALWIDKNGDGLVKKNEIDDLPFTMPWVVLPTSFLRTKEPNGNGNDYYLDYFEGSSSTFREEQRDLDGDGRIEVDIFETSTGNQPEIRLIDRDNDGFYDRLRFRVNDVSVHVIDFPMSLERHLVAANGKKGSVPV